MQQPPATDSSANPTDEVITFAGFLSDYDPSFVFIMTHETRSDTSYLKLLKVDAKNQSRERRYTFQEESDKKELIKCVKDNLI